MRQETKNALTELEKRLDQNLNSIEQEKFLVDGIAGLDTSRLGFTINDLDSLSENGQGLDRPIQDRIDDYSPLINDTDTQIISIGNSINNLKQQIVTLIGYAGTVAIGTVKNDQLFTKVENMNSRSYTGENPMGFSDVSLSSNVGVGSFNYLTYDSGTSIGSTGTVAYASTTLSPSNLNLVKSKYASIDTLRAQAQNLIVSINSVKYERRFYQSQRWGMFYAINDQETENVRLNTAINFIKTSNDLSPYV
jgi:hypothetical protein